MTAKVKNLLFNSVGGGAIIIAVFSILSRLLGLLRDRLLTSTFGAGEILDAYYAAFRLPDLIFNTLVLGALSSAFIPVFLSVWHKNKDEAWRVANSVLNILVVIIFVLVIIFIIFAPTLVNIFAHGFQPETRDLTTQLTRVMLFAILFFTLSSVASSILNSFRRFLAASLSAIMYNLGIIFGVIFLSRWLGPIGLALGVLIGAFLHFCIQVPSLLQTGYRWRANFQYSQPEVKKIGFLMLPRCFGLAIGQFNETVTTFIASGLVTGSVAIYNLAFNLISFPVNIFGASLAMSVFPVFSKTLIDGDERLFAYHFSKTVRRILYLTIPTTVICVLLRAQIVRLILGAGRFDWRDTILTANALGYFSLSLFAQSLIPVLARAFYAKHDTRTPVKTAIVGLIINVIGSLTLGPLLGVSGLAIAFSSSAVINFLLLFLILKKRTGGLEGKRIFQSAVKIIWFSVLMAIAVQLVKHWVAPLVNMQTFFGILIQFAAAVLIGGLVYLILSLLFKCEEIGIIKNYLGKLWPSQK